MSTNELTIIDDSTNQVVVGLQSSGLAYALGRGYLQISRPNVRAIDKIAMDSRPSIYSNNYTMERYYYDGQRRCKIYREISDDDVLHILGIINSE